MSMLSPPQVVCIIALPGYLQKARQSVLLDAVYLVFMESTAFATCLLSVTRTICLTRPFWRVNVRAVVVATVLFNVYTVFRHVLLACSGIFLKFAVVTGGSFHRCKVVITSLLICSSYLHNKSLTYIYYYIGGHLTPVKR